MFILCNRFYPQSRSKFRFFKNNPDISETNIPRKRILGSRSNMTFSLFMIFSTEKDTSISDGMFIRIEKKKKYKLEKKFSLPKKMEEYSSLHNHSDLSLLDGASKVFEMAKFDFFAYLS